MEAMHFSFYLQGNTPFDCLAMDFIQVHVFSGRLPFSFSVSDNKANKWYEWNDSFSTVVQRITDYLAWPKKVNLYAYVGRCVTWPRLPTIGIKSTVFFRLVSTRIVTVLADDSIGCDEFFTNERFFPLVIQCIHGCWLCVCVDVCVFVCVRARARREEG